MIIYFGKKEEWREIGKVGGKKGKEKKKDGNNDIFYILEFKVVFFIF